MVTLLATLACAGSLFGGALARTASGGLSVGWTATQCRGIHEDADGDKLDDNCEFALAKAFAPELIADPTECNWDHDAVPTRLGGGYYFAAQEVADGRGAVRIAYLPAYYKDCGWTGLWCALSTRSCSAHAGDSELIVVQVSFDDRTSRWRAEGIFLSAHCFGARDGACRWYRESKLRNFQWSDGAVRGAPRVWVSRGKHANYPTRSACDRGHLLYDTCDQNSMSFRFPVMSTSQNIGSRDSPRGPRPGGCTTKHTPDANATIETTAGPRECFWAPSVRFTGWQPNRAAKSASPYEQLLRTFAGF